MAASDLDAPLEFITIPPRNAHTATVIWLHGLRGSGTGMQEFAEELSGFQALGHIKWILPHAPQRPVTALENEVMGAWFDCYSFNIPRRPEDEDGLYRAVGQINDIITVEEKNHNIPSNRIIVGGLSQGSAVSMLTGLTTTRPLAGIFILSGYIPLRKKVKEIASQITPSLPIFWGHGRTDPQVTYNFSFNAAETLASKLDIPFHSSNQRLTLEQLKTNGGKGGLTFITYDQLGHWIQSPEEVEDLGVWIEACLPQNTEDLKL